METWFLGPDPLQLLFVEHYGILTGRPQRHLKTCHSEHIAAIHFLQ